MRKRIERGMKEYVMKAEKRSRKRMEGGMRGGAGIE